MNWRVPTDSRSIVRMAPTPIAVSLALPRPGIVRKPGQSGDVASYLSPKGGPHTTAGEAQGMTERLVSATRRCTATKMAVRLSAGQRKRLGAVQRLFGGSVFGAGLGPVSASRLGLVSFALGATTGCLAARGLAAAHAATGGVARLRCDRKRHQRHHTEEFFHHVVYITVRCLKFKQNYSPG